MKNINKVLFSLVFVGMSMISSRMYGQTLGGLRLKDSDDGPKGQFQLYGSFDYSKTSTPTSSGSAVSSSPIGAGYWINNNDLIGVNYAYSQQKTDKKVISKQNEAGFWYSPSVQLGKYFYLIAQVDADFVWGQQQSTIDGSMENFNGFRLRAYPMIGIVVGSGWALKFKFAELSMLQTKTKEGWSKSYVSGINGTTFGVGVSKNFNFKRKNKKS